MIKAQITVESNCKLIALGGDFIYNSIFILILCFQLRYSIRKGFVLRLEIEIDLPNDEKKIFRPAAWNAFGMDKEGQDYRACQTYGPMYK